MNWAKQPSPVRWRPITAVDARTIVTWRYEPPYDFYNLGEDAIGELLDPAQHYVVAVDETDELIGFACFGESAQVPGGQPAGSYSGPALDLGLGLRPDLAGRGNGARFVTAAIDFGRERFRADRFRLTVAAFNERAIRAYRRAGFTCSGRFVSIVKQRPVEFLVMTTAPESQVDPDGANSGNLGN